MTTWGYCSYEAPVVGLQRTAGGTLIDKIRIDREHFVARYLADQLSAAERADFEAYFLDHPEFVGELEVAAKLKAGLAALQAAERQKPSYRRRIQPLAARLAAAAMLLLLPFVSYRIYVSSRPVLATSLWAVPGAGTYSLAPTRSLYDASIELPRGTRAIRLRARVPSTVPPSVYEAVLNAYASGLPKREVARLAGLQREADGFVTLFLNSARVSPGRYELTLAPPATSGEPTSYRIRIEYPAP